MMGETKYNKAVKVLNNYMLETGKDYIYTAELRALMIRNIGGDEDRTIVPNLKMMREIGIIKEVEFNKWKIDLKKYDKT